MIEVKLKRCDEDYTYYKPFDGVIGVDWHIYDDGIEIDDHWTDNRDGTISRSLAIIGVPTAKKISDDVERIIDIIIRMRHETSCKADRYTGEYFGGGEPFMANSTMRISELMWAQTKTADAILGSIVRCFENRAEIERTIKKKILDLQFKDLKSESEKLQKSPQT